MVTLHEVITFLVSMQISISSLQTHNVNRCGRSRHLARRSEERFSRNAETDLVCRLLLEKKKKKRNHNAQLTQGEDDQSRLHMRSILACADLRNHASCFCSP